MQLELGEIVTSNGAAFINNFTVFDVVTCTEGGGGGVRLNDSMPIYRNRYV